MRVSIPKDKLQDTKTGHHELKQRAGFNIIGIMLHCYHYNMPIGVVYSKAAKLSKSIFFS